MENYMIKVNDVSVKYRLANDKILTLKEFVIALARKKIKYTEFRALNNISFTVEKGEVIGIIGHNGAGKSTLLKTISGIIKPTTGNVMVNGNIVPMLELGSGFDMDLSGRENIFLNGSILGYSETYLKSKYDEIVEFSELGQFIEMPLRNYSSGMVVRLAFSIASVVEPEILILDEVLSVGDADFQEKSKKRMKKMMSGGTTVLLVSHIMSQVREMCNRVVWIEHGVIQMVGETKKVCDVYEAN